MIIQKYSADKKGKFTSLAN